LLTHRQTNKLWQKYNLLAGGKYAKSGRTLPLFHPPPNIISYMSFCRIEVAAASSGGYLWRFSSGLVNTTTGAITGAMGLGVGSVKWVAGKGYDAGSGVLSTTKAVISKVPVPTLKKKPKKE